MSRFVVVRSLKEQSTDAQSSIANLNKIERAILHFQWRSYCNFFGHLIFKMRTMLVTRKWYQTPLDILCQGTYGQLGMRIVTHKRHVNNLQQGHAWLSLLCNGMSGTVVYSALVQGVYLVPTIHTITLEPHANLSLLLIFTHSQPVYLLYSIQTSVYITAPHALLILQHSMLVVITVVFGTHRS